MEQLFNQLWLYNNWANEALFDLFEGYGVQVPDQCMHLLSHIMNAQYVWASRIRGVKPTIGIWDDHHLEKCRSLHLESALHLKEVIENIDQTNQETISYLNSKGLAFENFCTDILMQVFNHGTYHRGQIAQELRRNGLAPVSTDYIAFVR